MDLLKTEAEIGKFLAEPMKLNAEAAKINRESRWYPIIWATTFAGAVTPRIPNKKRRDTRTNPRRLFRRFEARQHGPQFPLCDPGRYNECRLN